LVKSTPKNKKSRSAPLRGRERERETLLYEYKGKKTKHRTLPQEESPTTYNYSSTSLRLSRLLRYPISRAIILVASPRGANLAWPGVLPRLLGDYPWIPHADRETIQYRYSSVVQWTKRNLTTGSNKPVTEAVLHNSNFSSLQCKKFPR